MVNAILGGWVYICAVDDLCEHILCWCWWQSNVEDSFAKCSSLENTQATKRCHCYFGHVPI